MGVAPLDVGVVVDAEAVPSSRLSDFSLLRADAVGVLGGGALVC